MAVTYFGKELRKLRIEKDMILKDMADDIGVSVAMLSAIELGNRSIPKGFVDKVVNRYKLNSEQSDVLHSAAIESEQVIEFNLASTTGETAQFLKAFARELRNGVNESKVSELLRLVKD